MKFKRFMNEIFDLIAYHPNINLRTIKIVIEHLYDNLSPVEKRKYELDYKNIENMRSFQISINKSLQKSKISGLEKQLDLLKKSIN